MKKISLLIVIFFAEALLLSTVSLCEEVLLDAVVASVDGEPITVSDVTARMRNGNLITFSSLDEFASNETAKKVLDNLIMEQLIVSEAKARRIRVSEDDIANALQQIARNNNMSLEEFKTAVKNEGIDYESFVKSVEGQVYRAKLMNVLEMEESLEESLAVEEDQNEDQKLIQSEQTNGIEKTRKLSLVQVMVTAGGALAKEKDSVSQIKQKLLELRARVSDGEDFYAAVRDVFPEVKNNRQGKIMEIDEVLVTDLSPQISNLLSAAEEGEITDPIQRGKDIIFFYVRRVQDVKIARKARDNEEVDGMPKQVKKFFKTEIFKNHIVDKKV